MDPEVEQRVQVGLEGVDRGDVQNLVQEDIGVEVGDEEHGRRAGIAAADHPRVHGPPEVVDDDAQATAGGTLVVLGVERHHHRRRARAVVHGDGDGGPDDLHHEGHELLGEAAEDYARVLGRVRGGQLLDVRRHGHAGAAHGRVEEGLLGWEVPEDGRGGYAEGRGDVRQGSPGEALLGEDAAGRIQELIAGDARWAAHL